MIFRLTVFRLLSLLGLALSAALLVDHLRPRPVFCPFEGGCEEVTRSVYGSPLGVPLPAVGLAVFGALFALALFPAAKPARALRPLAVAAGLTGLALVGVQALVLRQVCPLCLAVDGTALLLAVASLLPPPREARSFRPAYRAAWAGLACLAVVAPLFWSALHPPPREVPPQIRALWVRGQINVIEITDFACPHCRRAHRILRQVLRQRREPIHLERLVVPLDYHPNARPAARAYLCAVRQGKGEPMADALFAADDLSPAALRTVARALGLDLKAYDSCVAGPRLDAQIDETARWVKASHPGGLPAVWVQGELLAGVQALANLRAALDRAALALAS